MKKKFSLFLVLILAVSFLSCSKEIDPKIEFYEDFRNSWNSNGYEFLDYYYPNLLDEQTTLNIKAKREFVRGELGEKVNTEEIISISTKKLDKWIFEDQTFYRNTTEIKSTLSYDGDHIYNELAYIVEDETGKLWIAYSQIRKEN